MTRTEILIRRTLDNIKTAAVNIQVLLDEDKKFSDYFTYMMLNSGALNILSIVDDMYEILEEAKNDNKEE